MLTIVVLAILVVALAVINYLLAARLHEGVGTRSREA